jgi:hypothetical protein
MKWRFSGVVALVLLLVACGKEPESATDLAMNSYLFGTMRSECVTLDGQGYSNYGDVLGRSFVEIHNVHFSPYREPSDRMAADIYGSIQRIVYHDGNCTMPSVTIEFGGEFSRPEKTDRGFKFVVAPMGNMIPHDEAACRFLVDTYKWADKGIVCTVGKEYVRDEYHVGEAPADDGTKKRSALHFEVRNGESGGVNVLGPNSFFDIVTRYRRSGWDGSPVEPSYKLFPQGSRESR